MFPQRLDSPLAFGIARTMMDGFHRHYRLFRSASADAKQRFEAADWHGQQRADVWQQAKLHYVGLPVNHRHYDEIEYVTDCHFRRVPAPRNEEDEMSGEVWYPVGPRDVFPETFGPFLFGHPAVRETFLRHHADLLDTGFWQQHNERIAAGHVYDVFPYGQDTRFAVARAAAAR